MSSIAGRHEQTIGVSQLLSEPEVDDSQRLGPIRVIRIEDVRRLEIAMHHAVLVQVLDRGHYDAHNLRTLALRQRLLEPNAVE